MAGFKDRRERRDREKRYRRAAMLHPLRQRIARQLLDGREVDAGWIAVELDQPLGRIAYHLRVLRRRGALRAFAQGPAAPALYRWSPQAHWARKMLAEIDQQASEQD